VRKTPKAGRLKLVHTNIWGKALVPFLRGSLYFVTFIDDSNRNVRIYFLKHKSDVFNVFKRWLAQSENEFRRKLKFSKSDNEGEHSDGRFQEFCMNQEIRKEKMVPENPHHNRVTERMNRTMLELARSIQMHIGLP